MVANMNDWNGKEIKIAKSKGGKICVCNYEENLIIPNNSIWPHPDIVKKLYKSNHSKDFDERSLSELSGKLGFYCDLQSLRSEDAITWSVFGTLNCYPKSPQVQFVNLLLEKIGETLHVNDCSIQLWSRIAHPDTLVSGGPELDFLIVCDKLVLFGESKWMSKVAKHQGKKKDKDQLQLRTEFLQKYGKQIFSKSDKLLVLVVGDELKGQDDDYSYISWETLCKEIQHPLGDEIEQYYLWKMKFGR